MQEKKPVSFIRRAEVSALLAKLVDPQPGNRIADPPVVQALYSSKLPEKWGIIISLYMARKTTAAPGR